MDCKETLKLLYKFMDSDLDNVCCREFEEHLLVCAQCKYQYEFEKQIVVCLRKHVSITVASKRLKSRIVKRIKKEKG
ncbi:MAG: zf-HC2 domain-containing protein [bacterium]